MQPIDYTQLLTLFPTIESFVSWLALPVGGAWIVSTFLENTIWFKALPNQQAKFRTVLAAYLLISLVNSTVTGKFAAVVDIPTLISAVWITALSAIVSFASGERWHEYTKKETVITIEASRIGGTTGSFNPVYDPDDKA